MSDENKETNNFTVEGFSLLYMNEKENEIRHFFVDFQDLNKQAEIEKISKQEYNFILYGFENAMKIIFGNYNVFPKETPVDPFEKSLEFYEKILQKISEIEKKQIEEMKKDDDTEGKSE
jgi:hypothetical protein